MLGMLAFPLGMQAQLAGDCASPKLSPVAGTATVNLNYTEWTLANDFYACMYTAGKSDKPVLSKTYLRHDCNTNRVYVLVLTLGGSVDMSGGDAWIRLPSAGRSTVVSGSNTPPGTAFSWVYDNGNSTTGTLMGFEAYFTRTSPFSDDIEVHLNIAGNTSSTGKISQGDQIPFSLSCAATCDMTIDKIIASPCQSGTHDIEVRVTYVNAPAGDIEILANGTVHTFTPSGAGCDVFNVTGVSCAAAVTVEARFKTSTSCNDQLTYTPSATPPSDPMGYIYCEETGDLITGGSIEVVAPNNGTVIQINEDGTSGRYSFDVLAGPYGDFCIIYNPPTGYALSTLHTEISGPIDLTTFNGGSDITLGQDVNGGGTALDGFNSGTYQADNPFYTMINIDGGDPDLFQNNIPLSGCVLPAGPSFPEPVIASPFDPLLIPCSKSANENDEDLAFDAPATTFSTTNCNGTVAPEHSMWIKLALPQGAVDFQLQVILNGSVVPDIYWEMYHSTVAGVDNPASLTPYIPNGGAVQLCGTNYTGWNTYNTPAIISGGDVYVYIHIYTIVANPSKDIDMNVKARDACGSDLEAQASNGEICLGLTTTVVGTAVNTSGSETYAWQDLGTGTATNITLANANTSTATVDASGATATAGTVNLRLTVTDGAFSDDIEVTVTVHPKATVTAGSNSPVCEQQSINLTATGSGAGDYVWTGQNTFNSNMQNPQVTANAVKATHEGSYTVTFTDGNSCIATANTSVAVNLLPTGAVGGGGSYCAGQTAPNVTFTFTGAVPFDFTYNDGTTSFPISGHNSLTYTITGAAAGTYQLTALSDNNSCSANSLVTSVMVTENPTPVLSVTSSITNTCPATTVDLTNTTVTGLTDANTTAGMVSYHTVVNPANSTDQTVSNPATAATGATYYIRKQTTVGGCVDIVPIVVTATTCVCTNQPTVSITPANTNQCGTGTATLSYTVANGPTTSFTEDGAGSLSSTSLGTGSGTFDYTVMAGDIGNVVTITATIADPDGAIGPCIAASASATVTVDALPTAATSGGGSYCAGTTAPDVTFTFTGQQPFDFSYTDGTTTFNETGHTSTTFVITGAAPGTYAVTALTDNNSCVATTLGGNVAVTENNTPTATTSGGGSYCIGQTAPNVTFIFQNGTSPFTFTYTNGTSSTTAVTGASANFFEITNAAPGTYSVTAATDNNGCAVTSFGSNAVVTENPLPTATTSGGGSYCAGQTAPNVTFTFTGKAPYDFTYNNGTILTPVNNHPSSTFTITGAAPGTYSVTALTDDNTCAATNVGGNVAVIENPNPDLSVTSPIMNVCPSLTVDLTNTAVTSLVDNNTTGGTITYHTVPNPANGTANTVPDPTQAATGTTYWIRSETANGCIDIISIVVNTIPCHAIGNMVWNDNGSCSMGFGNNGVFDAGSEAGIDGVSVSLFEDGNANGLPDGPSIGTDVTANGGFYLFDGLAPGNYLVRVNGSNFAGPLNGMISSTFTEFNANNDGDNNDNGRNTAFLGGTWSNTISLGTNEPLNESPLEAGVGQGDSPDNQANMTIDFGFVATGSFGDYVWEDVNHDGLQGSALLEPPVQGVTVRLYQWLTVAPPSPAGDIFIGSQVTNAGGNYLFENLTPCRNYYVQFGNLPQYYELTHTNQGPDDEIDSDPHKLSYFTSPTVIEPNENDLSWDAGIFLPKASIGDLVWDDLDEDGTQDTGEPGVSGVTVTLHACGGGQVGQTMTGPNGRYSFTNLNPGFYYVRFQGLPAGYVLTSQDTGTNDANDSDADANGQTICTELTPYENDLNWDAGIYLPKASLGNKVWNDADEDGEQDPNEPGVPNVKAELFTCAGVSVATTTTDAQGNYLFSNLTPGGYYVVFSDIPQDWTFSPQDNVLNDDVKDSDANGNGQTACTTLSPGEDERDVDAGIHLHTASIGDKVWKDLNENGIQEPGEPGVPGVRVVLQRIGSPIGHLDTTQTDILGRYYFNDVTPGDYCIIFYNLPADYVASPQDAGTDNSVDSDPNTVTLKTITTTLDPGEDDPSWDLGIYLPKASLGNKVWNDEDEDGIQDPGENGVTGIRVVLYDCAHNFIDQMYTNASGEYLFDELVNGDYYVVFKDIPAGYVFSPKDVATNDGIDSDADAAGKTACTHLDPGENDLTHDGGIYLPKASLGDCVWYDENENGIQDPGESGVAGITVSLYDGSGGFISSQTTNLLGKYLFDELTPGDYSVKFTGLGPGWVFTNKDTGTNDGIDSDADVSTGATITTTLDPNENDLTWDAGIYIPKASLGDKVWYDTDEDGEQDLGENGVSGVDVHLYTCGGIQVASTMTDGNGNYLFENLLPGSYYVVFDLLTDHVFSPKDNAADALDSDAGANGHTACTTLSPGEDERDVDAGIYEPKAKLGDKVFEDANNNGVQDIGESGVFGVKVTLYDCGGTYQTHTFTDGDGEYMFENLMPGSYYVVFSDLPFNYAFSVKDTGLDDNLDSDADASGQTACVSLVAGEINLSVDAGIFTSGSTGPNGRIGNRVFDDIDEDGEQDPNEPGVENVKVTLYDCNGNFVAQQHTDGNGNYLFINLASGSYYVKFEDIPAGYSFTGKDQGSDDAKDSDADSNGETACITLLPGESNLTVDGGLAADRVKVCAASDFAASGHGLLFTSGTYPGADNRYGFDATGGEFITYANGTARLTGNMVNKSNANMKFCVELRLILRKDWGQWSAQGGLAKGSQYGPFMTWDYYEVDGLQSRLEGKGTLAGEVLTLSHMPVSRVHGPQVGDGANDRNTNYGMSGWWFFNSASGNYSGTGDFNLNLDNCQNLTPVPVQPKLGAMALLQGAYDPATGLMRTDLSAQSLLPTAQPFNAAPWNYTGTETIATSAPDSITDWVLIELRDVNNPETILARQAGVLIHDGQLVQADGFSLIELPQNVTDFYLVIYNWNHLSVMSSQPLQKFGNVYYHDFTAGLSNIYQDLSLPTQPAMVITGGKSLLFEGDATGDELINSLDLGQVLLTYFNTGLFHTDVNMDGIVNSLDVARAMQNYFKRSHVPR